MRSKTQTRQQELNTPNLLPHQQPRFEEEEKMDHHGNNADDNVQANAQAQAQAQA
jgi:hypothetical protein